MQQCLTVCSRKGPKPLNKLAVHYYQSRILYTLLPINLYLFPRLYGLNCPSPASLLFGSLSLVATTSNWVA